MTNNASSTSPYDIDDANSAITEWLHKVEPRQTDMEAAAVGLLSTVAKALATKAGFMVTGDGTTAILLNHEKHAPYDNGERMFLRVSYENEWRTQWWTDLGVGDGGPTPELTYDPGDRVFVGPSPSPGIVMSGVAHLTEMVLDAFVSENETRSDKPRRRRTSVLHVPGRR